VNYLVNLFFIYLFLLDLLDIVCGEIWHCRIWWLAADPRRCGSKKTFGASSSLDPWRVASSREY